jgi:hypothetical protein
MIHRAAHHHSRSWLAIVVATTLIGSGVGAGQLSAATPTSPRSSPPAQVDGPEARLIPFPGKGHFVRRVTNRYFPLAPGSTWVYRGHGGAAGERIVVRVLKRTRTILGVRATVVSDRAWEDGTLVEETRDWYAQDDRGRVWYLGEATKSLTDGSVSHAGSWEAGVDGARPGVVMFPRGRLNRPYYQEYYVGHAEDVGTLIDRRGRVAGPTEDYRRVRITKDITALEPEVFELKFYAPGVGLVLELGTSPEVERIELVRFRRG